MCQSIINPLLKVEGSNPGTSILKFGLFQFSKWLCGQEYNFGFDEWWSNSTASMHPCTMVYISVYVAGLGLRDIQSIPHGDK